ncbi:hypothetical protein RND81_11G126200 [Saponaria officinalis]|uniref:Thionin-like protein n=1 Tax=Saponaria officinalis TaxID=3572 RepID=A0AAW1HLC5_SAPOF
MEGLKARKNLSFALILIIISGVFVNQSSAKFGACVGKCALGCVINPNPLFCGAQCIIKCIGHFQISINEVGNVDPKLNCHYDCAISRCAPLIAQKITGK